MKRHKLQPRQSEILRLVALDRTNKQIADELCISVKTVEKHRTNINERLNLHSSVGLTLYAIHHKHITKGEIYEYLNSNKALVHGQR